MAAKTLIWKTVTVPVFKVIVCTAVSLPKGTIQVILSASDLKDIADLSLHAPAAAAAKPTRLLAKILSKTNEGVSMVENMLKISFVASFGWQHRMEDNIQKVLDAAGLSASKKEQSLEDIKNLLGKLLDSNKDISEKLDARGPESVAVDPDHKEAGNGGLWKRAKSAVLKVSWGNGDGNGDE